MPAISILSAVMLLSNIWMTIANKIFTNCFRKCGVSKEAAASVITDSSNLFAGLEEDKENVVKTLGIDLNFLRTNCSDQVETGLATDEYIDFDHELLTQQSIVIDKDIIHEVVGNSAVTSNEDDIEVSEVESISKPLIEEIRCATEMLEEFSLYLEFEEGVMKSVSKGSQPLRQ